MNKVKLKLNNHLVYLLEISKAMLGLDDFNNSQILNKLSSCVDADLLTNYEVNNIKITSKKVSLDLTTYTQGEVMIKTNIKLRITKDKDNNVKIKTDCESNILWSLFSQENITNTSD